MKTIWKFELAIVNNQIVSMPMGAKILTIQMQREIPCLWALVNSDNEMEDRKFLTYGTGHPIEKSPIPGDYQHYIGTYQTDIDLVFHVFLEITS